MTLKSLSHMKVPGWNFKFPNHQSLHRLWLYIYQHYIFVCRLLCYEPSMICESHNVNIINCIVTIDCCPPYNTLVSIKVIPSSPTVYCCDITGSWRIQYNQPSSCLVHGYWRFWYLQYWYRHSSLGSDSIYCVNMTGI